MHIYRDIYIYIHIHIHIYMYICIFGIHRVSGLVCRVRGLGLLSPNT